MSECRVCLVNNVRMHSIYNTWYQDMYEKLSGLKLGKEDGKPETVCYVCTWQLQKFYNFFEMAQNAENILTKRFLFGEMVQETDELKLLLNLKMTATQSISYIDNGEDVEPEVIVTVKEEPVDYDESEFKEEYLDSPFTEDVNNQEITNIESTPDIGIHIPEVSIDNMKVCPDLEDEEFQNIIKTEPLDEDNPNIAESLLRNLELALDNFKPDLEFCQKMNKNYYCNVCNYKTHTANALRTHSRVHDPKNQFSCKFCAYRFVNEKKLTAHRNYCTVCNICGKKFSNTHALKIHIRLHTGIQPYVCDTCGRGFNQKTNLQTHLRVHTRDKKYPCLKCNKIFPFKSFLQRHMLIHGDNVDEASFRRIIDCHKVFVRKRNTSMSACTICGKVLCSRSLAMHMKLHTGEKIACERCNRVFIQKCNLLTHVERVHAGDETLCCQICYKMFPFSSEMWTHLATHDNKPDKQTLDIEMNEKQMNEIEKKEIQINKRQMNDIEKNKKQMNEKEMNEQQMKKHKMNEEQMNEEDIEEKMNEIQINKNEIIEIQMNENMMHEMNDKEINENQVNEIQINEQQIIEIQMNESEMKEMYEMQMNDCEMNENEIQMNEQQILQIQMNESEINANEMQMNKQQIFEMQMNESEKNEKQMDEQQILEIQTIESEKIENEMNENHMNEQQMGQIQVIEQHIMIEIQMNEKKNEQQMNEQLIIDKEMNDLQMNKIQINEKEFEKFNQKFLYGIHRSLNRGEPTPYPCDICGNLRVLSY